MRPSCRASRRGQCHDENCPKRHPRSWDPQLVKDSSDTASETRGEEPDASVKGVSTASRIEGATSAQPSRVLGAGQQSSLVSVQFESTASSAVKPERAEVMKTSVVSQADSTVSESARHL